LGIIGYNYIMANEQLLNYIKQARQSGKNNEQIRQELINTGWRGNDIDEALKVNHPISKSFKFPVLVAVVIGIAIVGYFASAYYFTLWPFEVSVAPVPTFTPRPSLGLTPTPSSQFEGWKTYTKEKATYGIRYQVSYPPGWTPSIDEFYFSIEDKGGSIFTIETPPLGFGIDTTINEEDIVVDGRQAIRINFKGGNNRDRILVQFKDKSLENIQIQFNTQEGNNTEIFDQILSTFKFIEPEFASWFSLPFKVGDYIGTMKVLSIEPFFSDRNDKIHDENLRVKFDGEATISGTYSVNYDPGPGCIYSFIVDKESENKVPRLGHENYLYFCFNNKSMPLVKEVFSQEGRGKATIVIDDYEMVGCGCEASDSATLVRVISKQ